MRDRRLVTANHGDRVRSLTLLLDAVYQARDIEKEHQCRRGITVAELTRLRQSTLLALEDYVAALDTLSWPVPRDVLQEIRLHRALLGVQARR